jgi:hypothetical protein
MDKIGKRKNKEKQVHFSIAASVFKIKNLLGLLGYLKRFLKISNPIRRIISKSLKCKEIDHLILHCQVLILCNLSTF